ncbi:hypothetical protein LCGC14_1194640 [marine sediment metagenome]|uniref:Recombination endonuclease VII n=1 Tax=marine sediment metagenome TaxID=412755 RepID=A0A0F9PNR3_9ZZZZ
MNLKNENPTHCIHGHELSSDNVLPIFKGAQGVRCRECFNARRRKHYAKHHTEVRSYTNKWRKNNSERIRIGRIKREYGISLEEYNKIITDQDNSCAVCNSVFKVDKKPVVDHDHITGKVRGLLCTSCNSGIGFLGDTLLSLKKACDYLSKSSD